MESSPLYYIKETCSVAISSVANSTILKENLTIVEQVGGRGGDCPEPTVAWEPTTRLTMEQGCGAEIKRLLSDDKSMTLAMVLN
ncbi:hypothetical protein E2C01_058268 [Portunus trituberculatus]|uniref:Uncharacterized protein n=1 Tax=Portunus trituberculatus TaxID=210409 RepID=A0A5B7H2Q8_PORTR|nr:hypothetical protein [Portunus trituberculatus]